MNVNRINSLNYELFAIDFLEGNLPEDLKHEFTQFLAQNPVVHEELVEYTLAPRLVPKNAKFSLTNTLYRAPVVGIKQIVLAMAFFAVVVAIFTLLDGQNVTNTKSEIPPKIEKTLEKPIRQQAVATLPELHTQKESIQSSMLVPNKEKEAQSDETTSTHISKSETSLARTSSAIVNRELVHVSEGFSSIAVDHSISDEYEMSATNYTSNSGESQLANSDELRPLGLRTAFSELAAPSIYELEQVNVIVSLERDERLLAAQKAFIPKVIREFSARRKNLQNDKRIKRKRKKSALSSTSVAD